jgi:hypothetical protein
VEGIGQDGRVSLRANFGFSDRPLHGIRKRRFLAALPGWL